MAKYYVSNTGDNANDGLSEANPWQTMSKARGISYAVGDILHFKRGDVFSDHTLRMPLEVSGVTVRAYGAGSVKPILKYTTTLGTFTDEGSNVWSITRSAAHSGQYVQVCVVNGTVYRDVRGNSSLTAVGQFYHDHQAGTPTLYVYSLTDPSNAVEVSLAANVVVARNPDMIYEDLELHFGNTVTIQPTADRVTVQNCIIKNSGNAGISPGGSTVDDFRALYNHVEGCRGVGIQCGGTTGYMRRRWIIRGNTVTENCLESFTGAGHIDDGAGIKVLVGNGDSTDMLIEYNESYNNGVDSVNLGHGLGCWVDTMNTGSVIVRYNKFYNNSKGGLMLELSSDQLVHDNIIYGNGTATVSPFPHGHGGIVLWRDSNDNRIYHNTVYDNEGYQLSITERTANALPCNGNIIHNNIFLPYAGQGALFVRADSDDGIDENIISHNCFGVEGTDFIYYGSTVDDSVDPTSYSTYDAWETAYAALTGESATTNHIETDPGLKSPADGSADLPTTSDCAGAVSLIADAPVDFNGETRSATTDIGAKSPQVIRYGPKGSPLISTFETDADPLPSAEWSATQHDGGANTMEAVSGEAKSSGSPAYSSQAYDTAYAEDQEVWGVVSSKPGVGIEMELYLRLQDDATYLTGNWTGYQLTYYERAGDDDIQIWRHETSGWTLLDSATTTQEIAVGDAMGLVAEGDQIVLWHHDQHAWSVLATFTDDTLETGDAYVGIGCQNDTGGFTSFGGGKITQTLSVSRIDHDSFVMGPTLAIVPAAQTLTPTGITTMEAVSAPSLGVGVVTLSPVGAVTQATVGSPVVALGGVDVDVDPTGIASGEIIGTPSLSVGAVSLSSTGIASGEIIGTPSLSVGTVGLSSPGIASSETLGSPGLSVGAVSLSSPGIASGEIIGTPILGTDAVAVTSTGVPSGELLGTPSLSVGAVNVSVVGASSGEIVGTPNLDPGSSPLSAVGIASEALIGAAVLVPGDVLVLPAFVPTAAQFGTPLMDTGGTVVSCSSVVSSESVSAPVLVVGSISVAMLGIPSASAFGSALIQQGQVALVPVGIASDSGVGSTLLVVGAATVTPDGVVSVEAFGVPGVDTQGVLAPVGIASGVVFGSVSIVPGSVVVSTESVLTAEVVGAISALPGGRVMVPGSIAAGVAFGVPDVVSGVSTLTLTGIDSGQQLGSIFVSTSQDFVAIQTVLARKRGISTVSARNR